MCERHNSAERVVVSPGPDGQARGGAVFGVPCDPAPLADAQWFAQHVCVRTALSGLEIETDLYSGS